MAASAPEVRQNVDPKSDQFGAVAVKAGKNRWGVMSPVHGGHWATDDEVDGWTPGTFTAAAEPAKEGK
jgi:hypothetical protein